MEMLLMGQPALSEGGSVSLLDCHSTGDLKYATGVARSNRSVPRDEAQDVEEEKKIPQRKCWINCQQLPHPRSPLRSASSNHLNQLHVLL